MGTHRPCIRGLERERQAHSVHHAQRDVVRELVLVRECRPQLNTAHAKVPGEKLAALTQRLTRLSAVKVRQQAFALREPAREPA